MDNTARLWDVHSGECLHTLLGHTAEIVSLNFDTGGQRIITGSFDHTVKVWDVKMLFRLFWGSLGLVLGAFGAFLGAPFVYEQVRGGHLNFQNFVWGYL